jgi:hypothetical protein
VQRLPALGLSVLFSGCLPFAVPPARVEIGAVPGLGVAAPSAAGEAETAGESPDGEKSTPVVLRGAIHPLQMVPDLRGRAIDFGVGYMVEGVDDRDGGVWRDGPYAELGVFPFRWDLGSRDRLRAGARILGESFLRDDAGFRAGATAVASVEITGFTDGAFSSPDAVGVAYGEWGLGVFAGPSVRVGANRSAWTGTVGLSARIPLAVGVVCCADLSQIVDQRGERARKRKSTQKRRHERHRPKVRRKHPRRERRSSEI